MDHCHTAFPKAIRLLYKTGKKQVNATACGTGLAFSTFSHNTIPKLLQYHPHHSLLNTIQSVLLFYLQIMRFKKNVPLLNFYDKLSEKQNVSGKTTM